MASKRAVRQAKARPKSVFPPHLQSAPDEWRAKKRQEWREVMFALDRFAYGSAYVPAQAPLYELARLAHQIKEAVDADGWVAW